MVAIEGWVASFFGAFLVKMWWVMIAEVLIRIVGIMAFLMAFGFWLAFLMFPIYWPTSFVLLVFCLLCSCCLHFYFLLCSFFLYFLDFCHYCPFDSYFYCLKAFPSFYFASKDFPH